jgi:hypothetical protein
MLGQGRLFQSKKNNAMLIYKDHPISLMILYAIALHIIWGPLLLYDPTVAKVTGLAAIRLLLPYPWASIGLISAALLSFWGLFVFNRFIAAVMLIPQQFFLMTAAFGAIFAIYEHRFPGVIGQEFTRPFMFASQLPSILAAIGHTVALLIVASRTITLRIQK